MVQQAFLRRELGGLRPVPCLDTCEIVGYEPIRQLTRASLRPKISKIPSNRALVRSRTYADQVLGRARFHANPTTREHALWRQHLLRRSAFRRSHLHLRLRHGI